MAAFEKLVWGELDVFAILVGGGVVTLEADYADRSLSWLRSRSYQVRVIDFARGVGQVVADMGIEFHWEAQFGYRLQTSDRNLARLRDGLWYEISAGGGLVLDLRDFESAFQEDPEWATGFLEVLSEHSLRQLALGRRFLAAIHLASGESPLVGLPLIERFVPYPYSLVRGTSDA